MKCVKSEALSVPGDLRDLPQVAQALVSGYPGRNVVSYIAGPSFSSTMGHETQVVMTQDLL